MTIVEALPVHIGDIVEYEGRKDRVVILDPSGRTVHLRGDLKKPIPMSEVIVVRTTH